MQKIAIDLGPLNSGDAVRGIGRYVKELLSATGNAGVDVSSEDLSKYDIVHFTRFNPFIVSVPFSKPKSTKFVLTIYDLIPLIYPKHYPPGLKGKIRFMINKYLIQKNVDAIITISETSKKDICRFFGVNPVKVHVIYLAAPNTQQIRAQEIASVKHKYNLPNDFALYLGDVNYNKNIPTLLEACKLAKIQLVISGKQAKEIERMDLGHPELAHLKNLDWSDVFRLGFVPDEDLPVLFKLAKFYIQPSLYEGFGLPVLEALANGCPVVCARTQALVEIASGAATFVNPKNSKDMAKGFKSLIKNPKLPRTYSWSKVAKETMEVYRSLIKIS